MTNQLKRVFLSRLINRVNHSLLTQIKQISADPQQIVEIGHANTSVLKAAYPNVNIKQVDYFNMNDLPEQSANLIVADLFSLPNKNIQAFFSKIKRTLKEGGLFIFSVLTDREMKSLQAYEKLTVKMNYLLDQNDLLQNTALLETLSFYCNEIPIKVADELGGKITAYIYYVSGEELPEKLIALLKRMAVEADMAMSITHAEKEFEREHGDDHEREQEFESEQESEPEEHEQESELEEAPEHEQEFEEKSEFESESEVEPEEKEMAEHEKEHEHEHEEEEGDDEVLEEEEEPEETEAHKHVHAHLHAHAHMHEEEKEETEDDEEMHKHAHTHAHAHEEHGEMHEEDDETAHQHLHVHPHPHPHEEDEAENDEVDKANNIEGLEVESEVHVSAAPHETDLNILEKLQAHAQQLQIHHQALKQVEHKLVKHYDNTSALLAQLNAARDPDEKQQLTVRLVAAHQEHKQTLAEYKTLHKQHQETFNSFFKLHEKSMEQGMQPERKYEELVYSHKQNLKAQEEYAEKHEALLHQCDECTLRPG